VSDPDQALRQWLANNPRDAAIRMQLAAALQQVGDNASAILELQRVLADVPAGHPLRPIALNNLAILYAKRTDPKALEAARAAYASAKDMPAVQDTYGWLLLQRGEVQEALPILEAAATKSPQIAEVRFHHAAALARAGNQSHARMLLEDVLLTDEKFEGRQEAERLLATL